MAIWGYRIIGSGLTPGSENGCCTQNSSPYQHGTCQQDPRGTEPRHPQELIILFGKVVEAKLVQYVKLVRFLKKFFWTFLDIKDHLGQRSAGPKTARSRPRARLTPGLDVRARLFMRAVAACKYR